MEFGGRQNKHRVVGRFFQRFQQRIERTTAQHMTFVNHIDFNSQRCGTKLDALDNFPRIIHTGMRSRIHLDHVHGAIVGD